MVVYNITTGRVRCVHETDARLSFTLMPEGHELSVAVLDDAAWGESTRLHKLEKTGVVRLDKSQSKKPVMAEVPEMAEFTKAQRAMVNGLVLGSDIEHQSYIDMVPLDNQSTMPDRPNYKYIREKMLPAFEVAVAWLDEIGTQKAKKRKSATQNRIKELNALVAANTR